MLGDYLIDVSGEAGGACLMPERHVRAIRDFVDAADSIDAAGGLGT